MLVRRWVARALVTVTAGLVGAVALGVAPAYADEVQLGAPGSFTAGSGPQNINLQMRREDDGCVRARAQLRIQADDLTADQVAVGVSSGGQVVQVQLQAQGDGDFVTQLVQPAEAEMCERRNRQQTVQFKVAFGPNAPNGDVQFVGFMFDEQGNRLAQEEDGSRIRGGEAAPSPTPSRTPSKSPSPSPTPEEEETEEVVAETSFASLPPDETGPVSLAGNDGAFGGLGVPIAIGVVMVGVGVALIVLLIRRNRAEGDDPLPAAGGISGPPPAGGGLYRPSAPGGGWAGGGSATQVLPAQPPLDPPTQRYPGASSGPNANRPPRTPPDPTTRMPRVTE